MAKSCYFSKIFDPASYLPARSLPVAALLVLRRWLYPARCLLPAAYFGCGYAALRLCGECSCHRSERYRSERRGLSTNVDNGGNVKFNE
ncbi:MAG: hypothetical protein ACR2L2_00455 [Acidobacteriota bacterium]